MNYIFPVMIIMSVIFSFIKGNCTEVLNAGLDGCKSAVETLLSFSAIMCFWSGILNVLKESGADKFINKLLSPLVNRLFPKSGTESRKYITLNITANMLGMGNAATPMGIKAMEALDKENNFSSFPSRNMCMLVAVNTTSIQLIPTTVISLRAAAQSADPSSVIPLIWITSVCSFLASVTAVSILHKKAK